MSDVSLAASVVRSVQSLGDEIGPEHEALVDLAMRYALQIDKGVEAGGQAATKALYLGPHLLRALAELGCTPGKAEPGPLPAPAPQVADELKAMRRRRGA